VVNAIIKSQGEHTTLTLENYKANFCIFLQDLCKLEPGLIDNHQDPLKEKILRSIYVALKGDIYSSPNSDTILNISMVNDQILFCISCNDQSKFRASILSFLRLVNLICLILFRNT
jgi:tRNA threonylcarbamoyladenosine modification (KEOPS) complex  Pcc1 subunit